MRINFSTYGIWLFQKHVEVTSLPRRNSREMHSGCAECFVAALVLICYANVRFQNIESITKGEITVNNNVQRFPRMLSHRDVEPSQRFVEFRILSFVHSFRSQRAGRLSTHTNFFSRSKGIFNLISHQFVDHF